MAVKKTAENRIGKGKPGPGRPKGMVNKTTKAAKEAIAEVFDRMGGANNLLKWGKQNEKEFYTIIWPKIIPLQVGGDPDNPIVTEIVQRVVHPDR